MSLVGNLKIVLQLKDARWATHFWKLVSNGKKHFSRFYTKLPKDRQRVDTGKL